ncbi:alanine/glycine:cation symporter family protein [Nesterenkonia sp. HG001]|uniref:alanine/glycine:cation symporter family protein n=1 Tax=Nesterenkonia sp. HG001 TaxID=2983207 RepID=UPI002AC4B3C6|nr:alanine/glycine:cation symporter family protein [Nesterenkonia sp. HG001]MDZ5078957.1 alanine:cation symporter family protein [Nesterenkonia sp. HG001]
MTMDSLLQIIGDIEEIAWNWLGIWVIIGVGAYMTIRTGVVQLRHLPAMFTAIVEKARRDDTGRTKSLSAFQAFTITASARVGTGNIAGVAGAIAMGGPGAIFWMWVMAILNSAASFVESTLAQLYKTRRFDTFKGGPAYYIQRGLGSRSGGIVFAVIFIFCFALSFTSLQANTVVDAVTGAAGATGMADTTTLTWILAVVLTVLTGLIVVAGLRSVARVAQNVVPLMASLYIILGLVVIIMNIEELPRVLTQILGDAFDMRSAAGGAFGMVIMAGVQRGMFSNEAGMGSVPNVAATADVSHPAKQGLVQTLGVYLDTIIICSVTAFIILFTFEDPLGAEANLGVELTQGALEANLGAFGAIALAVIITLVAFTSILGNYSYGEANILFISSSETVRKIFALVLTGVVFLGSIMSVDLAWAIAGVTMVIIALFNLVVICLLGGKAFRLLKHFDSQRKQGLDPVFVAEDMPDLKNVECWDREDVSDYLQQREAAPGSQGR